MLRFSKIVLVSSLFFFFLLGGSRFAPAAHAATLDVTNAEKLSLDPDTTEVGQKVRVSDGFAVSGANNSNGFFYPAGTSNGKPMYFNGPGSDEDNGSIHWDNEKWVNNGGDEAGIGDTTYPWEADWSGNVGFTLTHPTVQELVAPSEEQGGVFVLGGVQDGVWTDRGELHNGKKVFELLGGSAPGTFVTKATWSNSLGDDQNDLRWEIHGSDETPLYYSLSDVATPDLATDVPHQDLIIKFDFNTEHLTGQVFETPTNGNLFLQLTDSFNLSSSTFSDDDTDILFNIGTLDTPSIAQVISKIVQLGGGIAVNNLDGTVTVTISNEVLYPPSVYNPQNIGSVIQAGVKARAAWQNANDDSPASITVTSITQGELDAGATVAGAGTTGLNTVFVVNPSYPNIHDVSIGYNNYGVLDLLAGRTINVNNAGDARWSINDEGDDGVGVGAYFTDLLENTPIDFPWNAPTWVENNGEAPPPTVSRNDVASEANWQTILTDPVSLQFGIEPSNTLANTPITPAVTVKILDSLGHLVSSSTASVTLSLENGSGTLSGTLTKSAVSGVATFDDLSLNTGDTYSLHATSDELTDAISSSFFVCDALDPTLDLTNAEKLSLTDKCPGQKVTVSDGFVVSGIMTDADGFFAPIGTLNNKTLFASTPIRGSNIGCYYTGSSWQIATFPDGFSSLPDETLAVADNGDETNPWDATWSDPSGTILTHPAVQQLTAPSAEPGGIFVSGGTRDGVYEDVGLYHGKKGYILLGHNNSIGDQENTVTWETDINSTFGQGPIAPGFVIAGIGEVTYYSLSDTLTPDLASNWKNASDDSPASITVTSITQGELDAGATVAGSDEGTGIFTKRGGQEGRPYYNRTEQPDSIENDVVVWGNNQWTLFSISNDAQYSSEDDSALPFLATTWQEETSNPPPPTVSRNNVAAEANWQISSLSATALSFNIEPTSVTAGATISPAVTVEVLGESGNLFSTTTPITLSISNNPSSGTLSGTLTQSAINGVATFSDLSINTAGALYTLLASAGGLTSTTSTSFNITAVLSVGGGSSGGGTVTTSAGGSGPSTPPGNTSPVPGCPLGYTCTPNPPPNCPLGYTCTPTNSNPSFAAPPFNSNAFTHDLTLGDRGEDVRQLQIFLNSMGFPLASTGPGSPGNETNYFGTLTKNALAKFQAAHGISPALGYFGPVTRAYIQGLRF